MRAANFHIAAALLLALALAACDAGKSNPKVVKLAAGGAGTPVVLTGSIVKDQAPEDDALPSYFHLQLPDKLGIDAAGAGCGDGQLDRIEIWLGGFETLDGLVGRKLTLAGKIDCPRGGYVLLDIDHASHDGEAIRAAVATYTTLRAQKEAREVDKAKSLGFTSRDEMQQAQAMGLADGAALRTRNELKQLEWYRLPRLVLDEADSDLPASQCVKHDAVGYMQLLTDGGVDYRVIESGTRYGDMVSAIKVETGRGYAHFVRGQERCEAEIAAIRRSASLDKDLRKADAERYR